MARYISAKDASWLALLAENPATPAKTADRTVSAIKNPAARKIALRLATRLPAKKAGSAATQEKADALKNWAEKSRSTRKQFKAAARKKR